MVAVNCCVCPDDEVYVAAQSTSYGELSTTRLLMSRGITFPAVLSGTCCVVWTPSTVIATIRLPASLEGCATYR